MVSSEASKILAKYNAYRAQSGQSQVKYTASRNTEPQKDVSVAKINLAQAQSREQIVNINEKMNANQQDIEMIQSDYRNRNPQSGSSKMNQELRVQNPQYGGLLDDQRNLQEQKQTLEDKLIRNDTILAGDLNKDAQSDFSGISNKSPMDSQAQVVPVTYGTQNPNDRVTGTSLEGTFADPNFGKNQSTIDAIYARQDQDKIDKAVQSNYFWQLRAGQVPIGKALYEPETKNTYYSGDTKLSEMAYKTLRMELTRMYLEDAGQTFDTPIGNVKTSPTKYNEARSIATRAEILNLPMGNLETYRPSLTKEGDYTGYIEPTEYRKQITTSSPSEFPSQQGDWNFYETGFGRTYTLSPKLNQFDSIVATGDVNANNTQFIIPKTDFTVATTGVMSFENTIPDDSKVIMGAGNVPSMLGGINLFMFGGSPLKGLTKEAGKVSDEFGTVLDDNAEKIKLPVAGGEFAPESETTTEALDYSGNKISEIPDDIWGQMAKGSQAEVFNIAQSVDGIATGEEKEYAPTVLGDILDGFSYDTDRNTYREYTNDFATNVGIFFESSATTLSGYSDPQVQKQVSESLIDVGEKFQKYPVYYLTTGAVEVGSMLVPVGKVGAGLKVGAQAVSATTKSVKLKSLTPVKEVFKTTDQRAVEIAQQFAGDASVKIVKKQGEKFIFINKIVKDMDFMPKMTTKTKDIIKTKIRFKKKDGSGLLKTPKKEQRILSDQGATIEKLGGDRFLVNLGEGQSGKGFGYAIIDLKNSRTGVIMKEFNPLEKPPRWVRQATTKDYPVEQLGNINWISNKMFKGDTIESSSIIKTLQKGRKEATGGEPFTKTQSDALFDLGMSSQQPVYLFRGGKPFFPINNPVTRGETVKDYFLTQMQKIGLKKNSKTLIQKDIGDDPDWVAKGYNVGGYKVPKSKDTRWTEMIETARKQSDEMDAFKNRKTTPYMSSFADEAGGTTKGSGGKKGGGNKGDGGDKSNKGNDGSSTKLINKDFSDPSIPIDRQAVDAMIKATDTPTPPPNLGGGLPLGSLFAPMAYGQTAPQVKATPPQSVQPAPRIGTNNLFRQQPTVQASASIQQTKSQQGTQVIPKTEPMFNTRINTNVIPQIKTDIMSMTDSTVKQIGAVSTQLDLSVRQDLMPKMAQVQTVVPKLTQAVVPKVNQMVAPKAVIENKKVTPPRPIPSMWGAPVLPVIPFNFGSGAQKKKKKSKKKKIKGEATAWAVPDVWFDAKGYYFSKGNAYVKGAKAKSPPKPKRVKKSKR